MIQPDDDSSPATKGDLRRRMRQRRRAFVNARGDLRWSLPEDRFVNMLDRGVTLASYQPYGHEADPAPIVALARALQTFVAWPRVDNDGLMRFYTLGPSQSMIADASGMMVPAEDGRLANPSIILLPLVAFDRHGIRLGQGGGHYDRALAALDEQCRVDPTFSRQRAVRIGIAWSVQECALLPRDRWDMPLDHIITEQEWITP
jgi:5-formyltetrahydrofolate cyclo-ligase